MTTILFGDVLGVTSRDIAMLAVLAGITLLVSVLLYRPFLVLSFNEQKAQLLGMSNHRPACGPRRRLL